MKNIFIRIVSVLAAVGMLMSLMSCGKTDDGKSTAAKETKKEETKAAETGNESESRTEATKEAKEDKSLEKYDSLVTVTQVRSVNPNITFADGESISDNFVSRFYTEKLNIKWEDKWTADPAAYYAKLNLDIASDELPDFFVASAQQINTMVSAGQLMDITEIYDEYAGDKLKSIISDRALTSVTYDGKLYAVPRMSSQESDSPVMWIRTDWMKQLGLSAPTTYTELVEYLRALKASGLCGSGAGLNFYGPGSQAFSAIASTTGAYYETWMEDENGKLVYSGVQPEMRAALQRMNELYAEGLIDSDFAIKGSTEETLIAQGSYGVVFGQYFYGHLIKGSVLNNPDATWEAFPMPANDEGEIIPHSALNVSDYFVVSANCAHPEALLKSMNLWMEIWKSDGIYRKWFIDTMLTDTYKDVYLCGEYALPASFDPPDANIEIGRQLRELYSYENYQEKADDYPYIRLTYNLIEDHRDNFYKFVGGEGWALDIVYTTAEKVFSDVYKKYQYSLFGGVYSEDATFYKTSLDTSMIETYYGIIMGTLDITAFDEFVDNWYAGGGDEIVEEVNKWYDEHK